MLASLVMAAAVAFPAAGTYTYRVATPNAEYTSTIVIAPGAGGLATHETFGAPAPIAQTDQQFDGSLQLRSFVASQTGKGTLTIDVSPTLAHYSIDGKTADAAVDHRGCALIEDNILTSSVMLPAVVQATHATQCTFILSTRPQTIDADVVTAPPATRPAQAPARDAAVTIHLASITETVWYDPQTLIPDYMDFGNGQSATLTGRSSSTSIPSPASIGTPLPSPTPLVSNFPSRDVTFVSKDGSALAGTVSYPTGAASRLPAVVLVAGSGMQDRNETVGARHLLFDLAVSLNGLGYVVLRYDKRGVGKSDSKTPLSAVTHQNYVDDVRAAFEVLASDPRVDASRIDLLGHSEGGEEVIAAVLEGTAARGLILLAPLSTPYSTALEDQVQRGMATQDYVNQIERGNAAFFASWNGIDPRKEIAAVTVPILIVHGTADQNVTSAELGQLVTAATLARRGVEFVQLPGDDHEFSTAASAYDPQVTDALATWLAAH